ncbi:MAG: valyl-tRNA synthase [Candidatus Nealsonbacteria bacterium CG18_big_fil_WC_8_21_14_2_50_37_10]|uniref:valine--tRNA ligase n=1 Tax=Candidatus Nealsonbacteria bacterium CG18_big_fil_WC_8_21_14_2_50_37_10 TaxID=1974717 RepID=A0A2H0FJT5_9BACT|nr:MAG: valyl-tRNA synthase [Candidatus Nealsonbacteria bacterium CG18_big_fil_WC_8_21_14_2_50_37_10]
MDSNPPSPAKVSERNLGGQATQQGKIIFSKTYDPKKVEDKIYTLWQKSGYFNPDKLPRRHKKPYCVIIPPPNVTGTLHMGHALNATIQDILIRWRRLQGYKTLWLPGTDHAGIATQVVVEKELKKEGRNRFDLGREKFIERIWQWKEKYGDIISDQLKKLGASCDWSRTRFTMDEDYIKATEQAFSHYYKKGLIYQGEKTVNWCPRCQTSLSDLELIYQEEPAEFYYIKYGPLTIATVRPETKLGDTAVAVNPKDSRYKNYIGKIIEIKTVLGPAKMKVIGDESVDINFGTGAMKVTPAHDIHDFELAEKHGLEKKQVIGPDGRMTKLAGKYAGLTVMEARKQIVEDMKKIGILEKVEPYRHNIARCYRCNAVIEPILSKQWFLKMTDLAKTAIEAVKSGEIKFIPKKWEKVYFDWLKNIRDWCISRQIWWGHKIPIEGVNDVLDTWFSSALWPFATLGWPKKTKDLKKFYPTNVLSTDRGIINLWVARMIFSGKEFMQKEPFKDVYIHATVLTREGKRMSKSLGTGIDPVNLIEKYGADATRFGISWQIMGGQDIRFVEDNIIMGRKFCNKLWNASRFVLLQFPSFCGQKRRGRRDASLRPPNSKLTVADKKILKVLDKTIKSVDKDLESFRFGRAARRLYEFFWHDFCDVYIEKSKKQVDLKTKKILLYVLLNSLKLLHPLIPFITEEIYQKLPIKNKKQCLMIEEWPK